MLSCYQTLVRGECASRVRASECVCDCMCVWERGNERERESVCVFMSREVGVRLEFVCVWTRDCEFARVNFFMKCLMVTHMIWVEAFICVTWLVATRMTWGIHMCDMARCHTYEASWSIHTRGTTHSNGPQWQVLCTCVIWRIYMCDISHLYVWCDAFICRPIHKCDTTHSHGRHDSFTRKPCPIQICNIHLYICNIIYIYATSIYMYASSIYIYATSSHSKTRVKKNDTKIQKIVLNWTKPWGKPTQKKSHYYTGR